MKRAVRDNAESLSPPTMRVVRDDAQSPTPPTPRFARDNAQSPSPPTPSGERVGVRGRRVAALLILIFATILAAHAQPATTTLDAFDTLAPWAAEHTDDTRAAIARVGGGTFGHALRLAFDFNGVIGYATARRALPLDLPPNYELSFWVRGDAPANALQFKLIDASGENVWWINRPDFAFTRQWQQIRIKKRQLEFAWGPTQERELKHAASIEFVVSSGSGGGKGTVEFARLELRTLPPDSDEHPPLHVTATSNAASAANALAPDGAEPWCSDGKGHQTFDVDLGATREFGGLALRWQAGAGATRYDVAFSDDAKTWRRVRSVRDGNGGDDALRLPESETRFVRLALHAGQGGRYCLAHFALRDLAWGATPNAFFSALAHDTPRGDYPRGFLEQPYWTLVGVDGGGTPALMSEDGALEPVKGGFSLEPFLLLDGQRVSWADVEATQSLRDGYLPLPSVTWTHPRATLRIDAFAAGAPRAAQLFARYRVTNRGDAPLDVTLALAVRPFQVNPPAQFLNSPGGASPIADLAWDGRVVRVNQRAAVRPLTAPDAFGASTFDGGSIAARLRDAARGGWRPASSAHDTQSAASGALLWRRTLPPHGSADIDVLAPMTGSANLAPPPDIDALEDGVAAQWRARLDRVRLQLPAPAQFIADSIRSAQAQILLSRDGAALRPGTRSYARSWIRDGAMIADALLRLGDLDAVRAYADWYAPHQFSNGKVPCCVDARGADPVPENDSEGELIHLIAQRWRFDRDAVALRAAWPRVQAAIAFMDAERARETGAANLAFAGLMPPSISHEGYSAKPMHSYWDDFWALTGYDDAVDIAQALGETAAATSLAARRDAFRAQILASIAAATRQHGIDYLPGCAELGDFDPTSSTIALAPGRAQALLPPALLDVTFQRYWRAFEQRAQGTKTWNDYTPYEWRNVGAFVRLGWRARALAALGFFFDSGARPRAWNQWAEVVGREPRTIRFIGDMPHAWVASDFIRSALDLFAYERAQDRSLVLAAGVSAAWLDTPEGVGIDGLHTAYGTLSYTLRRDGTRLRLKLAGDAAPPGGFVLPWPYEGIPGAAHIDGLAASWIDGALHIAQAPADVEIELGRDTAP